MLRTKLIRFMFGQSGYFALNSPPGDGRVLPFRPYRYGHARHAPDKNASDNTHSSGTPGWSAEKETRLFEPGGRIC
jgi:hypothetical protein